MKERGLLKQRTPPKAISMLGVRIHSLTLDALLDCIILAVQQEEKIEITYANVQTINLAVEHHWFRELLNRSELTYCDGIGVMLGARLAGCYLPERFTPPDWFPRLADRCAQHGYRLFFLGARPNIAAEAARRLQAGIPNLPPIESHHGHFNLTFGHQENEAVLQQINSVRPDILVVGMGQPLQEKWLAENWERLECHVALPVGAMFDYLAGAIPRAPRWMTDHGMEWLGRLWVEPGRLWRRYLIGIPVFLWRVFRSRFSREATCSSG